MTTSHTILTSSLTKEVFLTMFAHHTDTPSLVELIRYRFANLEHVRCHGSIRVLKSMLVSNKDAIEFFIHNRCLPPKLSSIGARQVSAKKVRDVLFQTNGRILFQIGSAVRYLPLSLSTTLNPGRLSHTLSFFGIQEFPPNLPK